MEEVRLRKTDMTLATLAVGIMTIAVLMIVGFGNVGTPVYASPLPTCHLCSIHADGTGTMTVPDDTILIPCHCDGCHADITFDATQNDKNSAFGKLTLIINTDDAGPHTVLGDINSGKITEKSFVLKGVITDTQSPEGIGMHFTINGQVGKGTINFQTDDGSEATFTGNIIVTLPPFPPQ